MATTSTTAMQRFTWLATMVRCVFLLHRPALTTCTLGKRAVFMTATCDDNLAGDTAIAAWQAYIVVFLIGLHGNDFCLWVHQRETHAGEPHVGTTILKDRGLGAPGGTRVDTHQNVLDVRNQRVELGQHAIKKLPTCHYLMDGDMHTGVKAHLHCPPH